MSFHISAKPGEIAPSILLPGDPLRAGQIVLAGALGPMAPLGVGDRVDADLGVLGHVSATFTGTNTPQEEK